MAVDYTEARLVDVDEGVYSTDYNKLALAFNDRLKNGVADPTWRLLWYAHSLVRGMRNPNGRFTRTLKRRLISRGPQRPQESRKE